MISLIQFEQATNWRPTRSVKTGWRKSSAGLAALHTDVAAFLNMPKNNLDARWRAATLLATKCHLYVEGKRAKGKDVNKSKYMIITQLENQLIDMIAKEKVRYVQGTTPQGTGISPGANNPHHAAVRFEKSITLSKGPNAGMTMHGQNLWNMALADNVPLTGKSDSEAAYLLRRYLKQLVVSRTFKDMNMELLEFLKNDQERAGYELDMNTTSILQNGNPFSTQGSIAGLPDEATLAISPGGTWYSRAGNTPGGAWHHSSYMGGGDVLFAGCIRTNAAGTCQYISNSSGHYSPTLDDSLNACQELRNSGLDGPSLAKVSFYYTDFKGDLAGSQAGSAYLMPMMDFLSTRGRIPNVGIYETTLNFGAIVWVNPGAARARSRTTAGPNGVVVFPN